MIALHRTKHSDFVHSVLKAGKSLNMAPNKFFILREMIQQSYDPQIANEAMTKWDDFADFIKDKRLEVALFALGFHEGRYVYCYQVQSKIHNNPAFCVQGKLEGPGVPFVFVPPYFATWLTLILSAVPYEKLVEVAEGG